MRNRLVLAALIVIQACLPIVEARTTSCWYLRGDISGDNVDYPTTMTADGTVVFGNRLGNPFIALRWHDGNTTRLPFDGAIYGATPDGKILVGMSGGQMTGGNAICYKDGIVTSLEMYPQISISSAIAVSDDGTVIAGTYMYNTEHGCRWVDGHIEDIAGLPGYSNTQVMGMSGDGSVIIGYSYSGYGAYEAFRWHDGVAESLGFLPGGSGVCQPYAISHDGKTIVGVSNSGPSQFQAFRWRDGVMTSIGGGTARSVSADGSVIVGQFGGRAFVWDEEHGMRSLEYVLARDYGIIPFALDDAAVISKDGSTIVGFSSGCTWIVTLDPRTCKNCIIGDINGDRKVDMVDFALMANNWMESN